MPCSESRLIVKSPFLVGVLVLIIAVAAANLLWFYGSQPEPGEPLPHPMPAACEACGEAYAASLGKQPAKCKICGEVALWRAFKCTKSDCGAFFPYKGEGKSPLEQAEINCPKCGGHNYTWEISPDELEQP